MKKEESAPRTHACVGWALVLLFIVAFTTCGDIAELKDRVALIEQTDGMGAE